MRAKPDDFVLLIPSPWSTVEEQLLTEAVEEFWQQPCSYEPFDDDGARIRFADSPDLFVFSDEAIPELEELAFTSIEPFGASELAMVRDASSVTRVVAPGGRPGGIAALQLASALVFAGAAGICLPAVRRLHSARSVRHLTMEINQQSLANLFVGAFDNDGWMRTRGLTPFHLPELETPIDSGTNAAYFRLMDLAAAMIATETPLPDGATAQIGPQSVTIVAGPSGKVDDEIPVNGIHGVLRAVPA